MKKALLLIILGLFAISGIKAEKVSPEKARTIAISFFNSFSAVKATDADASLVYTFTESKGGGEGVYVFNISNGFVMVSSDDVYRPIVGYSYEGRFDADNISPELSYYIGKIVEGRNITPKQPNAANKREWEMLMAGGSISRKNGRGSFFLCETLWDQDYPYNYYAPLENGQRTYAGCVACAMSQVMKFWDSPIRGTGYHEYEYGDFGLLSANFDTTYYDWENMPNSIYYGSTWQQINAIATLMYQCGIAVDMMYGLDGSGSYSEWVPNALIEHFSFTEEAELRYRNDYSLEEWQNMLKNEFDQGWPVYYSGSEETGGHAFVCDGYDDNDMFHFNWGWSGSGDGFFAIDELNVGSYTFNWGQAAIFNMVPRDVYENTPNPPTNFNAIASGDTDFNATVSWTTPETLRHGEVLPQVDKIVVLRNGKKVYEATNLAPGLDMSFTDHVGLPIQVTYEIYAEYEHRQSFKPITQPIVIGPTCDWRLEMASTSQNGWSKARIIMRNSAFDTLGIYSLNNIAEIKNITVPIGNIAFAWENPNTESTPDQIIHFKILNSQNQEVFNYNGRLEDMTDGTFLTLNNDCGETRCSNPATLSLTSEGQDILLNWDETDNEYGYIVYRDGVLHDLVEQNTYTDTNALYSNHYYSVTSLCSGGESKQSNIVCSGEQECEAPHNFTCSFTDNNKLLFEWEKPENATGLLGFTIYRRTEGTEYQRHKLLSASATSYKTSYNVLNGHLYQYCITATYKGGCESASANIADHNDINYLEVNKTILPSDLRILSADDILVLAWSKSLVAESYNVYRDGQLIAEGLSEPTYTDTTVEADNTYCYTVTGKHGSLESGQSNEACADFIVSSTTETNNNISLMPNPTTGNIKVSSAQQIANIEINNALGQRLANIRIANTEATINLSQYGKGVYIVKINTSTDNIIHKVIVM